MKKLSIIIPVYNVEKYIEQCLLSLLNQDIPKSEYDIIVVNDGTPDNSANIAKEIASKHSNITVYDKPNGGLSSARNYGIEKADSEYIMFVDSDDYIENNCLKFILNKIINNNLDMLSYGFRVLNEDNSLTNYRINSITENKIMSGRNYMLNERFSVIVCRYLYNLKFINNNHLRFKPYNHEDEEFSVRALYYCKKIEHTNHLVYNYVMHEESYINNFSIKNVENMLKALNGINDFINNCLSEDKEVSLFLKKRVNLLFYLTIKKAVKKGVDNCAYIIKKAKEDNIIYKNIYPSRLRFKYWLMIKHYKIFEMYNKKG